MGDRATTEIKTSNGSIYVYTHWGGNDLPNTVFKAVRDAEGVWGDDDYMTRVIIDQLTMSDRDSLTGSGISLVNNTEDEYNNDEPSVVVDLTAMSIHVLGRHKAQGTYMFERAFCHGV